MFLPLFIPAAERGAWKQLKQLADAECFSAPRVGGTVRWTDEKQLKTKPTQAPFLFGQSEVFFFLEEKSTAALRPRSQLL